MEPTKANLEMLARLVASTATEELDCEEILDLVAAYFESGGNVDPLPPELQAVAQHFEVCPPCLEEFKALVRAMGGDPDPA